MIKTFVIKCSSRTTMEMRSRDSSREVGSEASYETDRLLESIDPLDSDEQQAIIDDIQRQANRLDSSSRKNMLITYFVLAVIFFVVLGFSFLHPFEMSHQRVFSKLVPHVFFQVYYVMMCLVFLIAGYAVQRGIAAVPRILKILCFLVCCSLSFGWCWIFIANHVTEPSLYWLPCVPLATMGLTVYFDNDNKSLIQEVDRLKNLKYDYKKA